MTTAYLWKKARCGKLGVTVVSVAYRVEGVFTYHIIFSFYMKRKRKPRDT